MGFSLEKLAGKIHLTSGAIQRWEKDGQKFISPVNEIVLRAFFCSQYKVALPRKFDDFLGTEEKQKIQVDVA